MCLPLIFFVATSAVEWGLCSGDPARQMPHPVGLQQLALSSAVVCWLCYHLMKRSYLENLFLISESLWALKTVVSGPPIGEMKNYQQVKLIPLFTELKVVWVHLLIWTEPFGKIGFNFLYLCGFEKCNPSSCLISTIEYSSLPCRNLPQRGAAEPARGMQ